MIRTGRLSISNEESRLDGTLLARKGAADPLGAATSFLRNLGLRDGDCISVSGDTGTIGAVSVIFIDSASKVDESNCSGGATLPAAMALRSAAPAATPVAKKVKAKSAKAKNKTKNKTKKKAKPSGGQSAKKAKTKKTTPRHKTKKRKPRRRR